MNIEFYSIPYVISNLNELFNISTQKYKKRIITEQFVDGKIERYTYEKFRIDVLALSAYLHDNNFANSNILISGELNYIWLVSYFSILLSHSKAICIDKIVLRNNDLDDIIKNFQISCVISNAQLLEKINLHVLSYEKINSVLKNYCDTFSNQEIFIVNNPKEEIALVLFTSGTTGEIKPVYLTHENLAHDTMGSQMQIGINSNDRILSFLPVHHAFEQMAGILIPFFVGATICVSRGAKYAFRDISEYSPTIMPIVPLIADTLKKNIELEIKRNGKRELVDRLLRYESFPIVGNYIKEVIYQNIVCYLGGKLRTFVCGGASLSKDIQEFFMKYGFNFFIGYGITECSPVVCCSMKKISPIGSVGVPMPFCEIKFVNGEILVKGSIVARKQGQFINQHMDIDDGWFKTGDLGYMDDNNNVFITGRKKDIIILENGENVSPEKIESLVGNILGVKEIVICSTQNSNDVSVLTAIINPNSDYEKKSDNDLIDHFFHEIANLKLPNYFKIQKVIILRESFPQTSSGKIKRSEISKLVEQRGF